MKKIQEYVYKDYTIKFNYEKYCIIFPEEIPIHIWESIQKDEKYQLLCDLLTTKNSVDKDLYDADPLKLESLIDKYNKIFN